LSKGFGILVFLVKEEKNNSNRLALASWQKSHFDAHICALLIRADSGYRPHEVPPRLIDATYSARHDSSSGRRNMRLVD
jgi:hypothetical protein